MFTGLIESAGEVAAIDRHDDGAVITIASDLAAHLSSGDSIAVNGVCLTVTVTGTDRFSADAINETLTRTALGALATADLVNLERPLAVGDRLDGHIVQGHVDGVGEVVNVVIDGFSVVLRITLSGDLARYVVEKGSIAIEGVSLTVSAVGEDAVNGWFEVSLIPETLERTNLGGVRVGRQVNIEVDVLAKHVERLLKSLCR